MMLLIDGSYIYIYVRTDVAFGGVGLNIEFSGIILSNSPGSPAGRAPDSDRIQRISPSSGQGERVCVKEWTRVQILPGHFLFVLHNCLSIDL